MFQRVILKALIVALGSPAMWLTAPIASKASDSDWATYNKDYQGRRYSQLAEIDARNVGTLKRACVAQLGDDGAFQSGPVVANDTLYVTTGHTTVALNAATCEARWRHSYTPEQKEVYAVNRGVAVEGGSIFRGTGDGRILALDAATGQVKWKIQAADPSVGEFFSSAPIAWKHLLFIGIAGSDFGARGRMLAFDAATGKEVWRWHSIPMGSEPGAETWTPREAAARGGGAFWSSYTLDPATGELFIPVGNPAPDFNTQPGVREGDNLYTDSVVVLDAATGRMKWHHQFARNDPWDYDIGAAPMLYSAPNGKRRVAVGSKDGYLYLLDRESHQVLSRTLVTTVLDNAGKRPTPEGVHMCPGTLGGVEWNGPAQDAKNNAIVVGAVDICATYTSPKAPPQYQPGAFYYGGDAKFDERRVGWVTSVDAVSGKIRWRAQTAAPVVSGITPTAGGVTFAGDLLGNFLAFDNGGGAVLFQQRLGGGIAGGIVTYSVGGKQYVAVPSGNVSRATFGGAGTPEVTIFTLGLNADTPKIVNVGRKQEASSGKDLYVANCQVCHGDGASDQPGAGGPSLKGAKDRLSGLEGIVVRIKYPKSPMPAFSSFSETELRAVAEYVATLK